MREKSLRIEVPVHLKRDRRQRNVGSAGALSATRGPVRRAAKLLALAHKWETMVRRGDVRGCTELAELTGLTKARVTQVCSLTLVAPRFQEAILAPEPPDNPPSIHTLQEIVRNANWDQQQSRACTSHVLPTTT